MHYYYIPPLLVVKYYLYHLFLLPCYKLFVYVLSMFSSTNEVVTDAPVSNIPITTTSLTEQYIQRQTTRLLNTYNISSVVLTTSSSTPNYSENIDAVFYSKSQWTELLKDENNYLEKKWRTKILIENTPRGNVIMYYDAYKLGFAYYSDQTMPYPVLNAVAMKYVLTFFCRDFFMDEIVLGDTNLSGITKKHKEDADVEREEKKQGETPANTNTNAKSWRFETNNEKTIHANTKSPFAKFKSYNNVSAKSTNVSKPTTSNVGSNETTLAEPKQTNRFIHLGKTRNVSFLQKPLDITPSEHLPSKYNIDSAISGSLNESGIYSIFSPTSALSQLSFNNTTDNTISTPPPQLTQPSADNKPLKPPQKQQMTYAEYKRMQKENATNQ